jgi:hypothetical protein
VDDLGLNRAIELLNYWHREANPDAEERSTNWEMDQATAENQFNAATGMLGAAEIGIPEEMREGIRWCEEMKLKMKGGNG